MTRSNCLVRSVIKKVFYFGLEMRCCLKRDVKSDCSFAYSSFASFRRDCLVLESLQRLKKVLMGSGDPEKENASRRVRMRPPWFIPEFLVHERFDRRQPLRPDAIGHGDCERGVGLRHEAGYRIDRQYVQSIALTERR